MLGQYRSADRMPRAESVGHEKGSVRMADTTSAQKDAWKKKNMTQFCIRFHNVNDADIIERLRS